MSKENHYINNSDLYAQIKKWKEESDLNLEQKGVELPVSRELVDSIYTIVSRVASRYNFTRYSFREDMIQDAVYVIIKYIKNYDLDKTNPHAYITTCAWNAFLNKINTEKKNEIKKYKHYIDFMEQHSDIISTDNENTTVDNEFLTEMYEKVADYEGKSKPVKKKTEKNRTTYDLSIFF